MMAQRGVLALGDRVTADGQEHTVIGLSGTSVRLLSDAGAASVMLVAHLQAAPDFAVVSGVPAPTLRGLEVLTYLPPKALERARWWEQHILEVETGRRPDASPEDPGRPQYDPSQYSLEEREQSKATELTALGMSCSRPTVRRRRSRYAASGLAGLVDGRNLGVTSVTGRVDERVVAAIRRALAEQTEMSTGTRGRLRRRVTQLVSAEYGPDVALPSAATFYRLVSRLQAGTHAFGSATTRRSLAHRPARPFATVPARRPGERVQIDTSPLDVLAVLDDGVIDRVELTVMLDVATRTICAGVVSPRGTKAVDAALLLARAVVPEPMRTGWPNALSIRASRLPFERLLAADERFEGAAALPVIVPESIVPDRGKVFISQTFIDACVRLGISLDPARPGEPTDKPDVERSFGSIHTLFSQYVAGYTGRDVTRRGVAVQDAAVWTVAQLQELFDRWVIVGWQPRPHEGLQFPDVPRAALSPNEAYAALVSAAGYVPLALDAEDYLALLPVEWRRIRDVGIEIDLLTYDDPALDPLRGTDSGIAAHGQRWPIHQDPYDRGQVWLRHPNTGAWLEVPWVHRGIVRTPFADFTLRHVQEQLRARADSSQYQLAIAEALAALLDQAETGPDAGARTARDRRVAGRTRAAAVTRPRLPSREVEAARINGQDLAALRSTTTGSEDDADNQLVSAGDLTVGVTAEDLEVTAWQVFDPEQEAARTW